MSERKIDVIMPVTQKELAAEAMRVLDRNTIRPRKMYVIDDTDRKDFVPPKVGYGIEIMKFPKWLGVNAYWNAGRERLTDPDYVLFLNDDVILHERMLEMNLRAFDRYPILAVTCPLQVKTPEEVGYSDELVCELMQGREGTAFTFRKPILDRLPAIPKELVMYFGEDWWWNHTIKLGWRWGKVLTSRIYHYPSLGASQRGLKKYLKPERREFIRLTRGLYRLRIPEGEKL